MAQKEDIWLVDYGFKDSTLAEATNLRYRLMKGIPIKGWVDLSKEDPVKMAAMEDYLHNEDLAKEIVAGGQDSIINLRTTHEGLKRQERGYDYRMTADDQNRFSGTAWPDQIRSAQVLVSRRRQQWRA